MPITRTHDTDDDGTGTTGTPRNAAWKEEIYDQIDAYVKGGETPGVLTITNGGSNLVDLVLPMPRAFYYVQVQIASADLTIRSITPGRNGDLVLFVHNGAPGVIAWFPNLGVAGAGRLWNRVTSGYTPIHDHGSALYVFDGDKWNLAQHEQGRAIQIPFNASNYNTVGWGVDSTDLTCHAYYLRGNELSVSFTIGPTDSYGILPVVTVTASPFYWAVGNQVMPFMYFQGYWYPAYAVFVAGSPLTNFTPANQTAAFQPGQLYLSGNLHGIVT